MQHPRISHRHPIPNPQPSPPQPRPHAASTVHKRSPTASPGGGAAAPRGHTDTSNCCHSSCCRIPGPTERTPGRLQPSPGGTDPAAGADLSRESCRAPPRPGPGHRGVPGEAPGGSAPTRGPGPALTPRRPRAAPPAHGRRSGAGGPGGGGVPLAPPPLLSGLITSPISKPGPGCECGAPAAGRAGGRWVSARPRVPPAHLPRHRLGQRVPGSAPLREPRLRSFPAKPLSPAENRSVNPRPPNGSCSPTGTFWQRVSRVRGDNLRPPTPAQPLSGTRVPCSAVPVLLTHRAAGGCSCTRSFGGRACSGGPEPPSALALVQMQRPELPNRAGHC